MRDFNPSKALKAARRSRKSPVGGLGRRVGLQQAREEISSWERSNPGAEGDPRLPVPLCWDCPSLLSALKSLLSLRRTQGMELRCLPTRPDVVWGESPAREGDIPRFPVPSESPGNK